VATARYINHPIDKLSWWIGAGVQSGADEIGVRGVLGFQFNVSESWLFRVEGTVARAAGYFEQEWLTGGFVYWFHGD
jgi:hypothetical protein